MRVVVIEDVPEVVDIIRICFTIRWPDATVVSSMYGGDAIGLIESVSPDIVILDITLPDMDGLVVLQEIRKYSDVPVIVVTGHGEETVRVTCLEMGADDYLVKPFSHTELMARAKAVLRRSHMPQLKGDEGIVNGRGLSIDLPGRRLLIEGHEVNLTPTEWRFLSYLARNEGRVISHATLAEKVWGTEFLQGSAIKMCVRRLRQKLGDHASTEGVIKTHRGIGYSFARPS